MNDKKTNPSSLQHFLSSLTGILPFLNDQNTYISPHTLWMKLSDKRLTTHTNNIALRQKKIITTLIIYMDSSVMTYEAAMKSEAVLAEWNVLCTMYNADYQANKIEFKLSKHAKAKGENGSVTQPLNQNSIQPYEEIELSPLNKIEQQKVNETTSNITHQELQQHVKEAMYFSLRRKKTK